jgi:hypothetical protein
MDKKELIALIEAYLRGIDLLDPMEFTRVEDALELALLSVGRVVYKDTLYQYDTGLQHIVSSRVLCLN